MNACHGNCNQGRACTCGDIRGETAACFHALWWLFLKALEHPAGLAAAALFVVWLDLYFFAR